VNGSATIDGCTLIAEIREVAANAPQILLEEIPTEAS